MCHLTNLENFAEVYTGGSGFIWSVIVFFVLTYNVMSQVAIFQNSQHRTTLGIKKNELKHNNRLLLMPVDGNQWLSTCLVTQAYRLHCSSRAIITSILKSLVILRIWLAFIDAIYLRIAPFLALNFIFFSAYQKSFSKRQQPIIYQGLFKLTNQIRGI